MVGSAEWSAPHHRESQHTELGLGVSLTSERVWRNAVVEVESVARCDIRAALSGGCIHRRMDDFNLA